MALAERLPNGRIFLKLICLDKFMGSLIPANHTIQRSLSFFQAQRIVNDLHVVNDVAERGVALLQECNFILSKDDERKQCIMLAVTAT